VDKTKTPKAANWSATKCTEWLEENPIQDQDDISFLKNEVSRLSNIIICAEREREEEQARQQGGSTGMPWRGALPYLRLILCVIQDDIKLSYLRRADVMNHQYLDGRHSESRPPTAFELISDKWNNPSFNPVAPVSNCHYDFATAIDCSHHLVGTMMPATPQKVEDHLASFRTHLNRIIEMWERSGQGDGGYHAAGEDSKVDEGFEIIDQASPRFGALASRNPRALAGRAAFLHGKPSYLLYFWELADQHQLLRSALQRFDEDSGASDASSAPSAISRTHGTQK
jgi:hypothetical protein